MAFAAMAASANAVLATSSPSSHTELAGGGLGERNRSIKVVQDKVLPHLQKIFETHAGSDKNWTKEQIAAFLRDIQHQDSEDSNASKLLTYDELDFHKFLGYMTSSSAALTTPPKPTDLSWPLSSYFISSSHNTYLAGKQVFGESTTETYTDVLLRGCRCVEIDVWNGEDDSSSSSSSSSSSDEENSKAKAQKADLKAKKEVEAAAKPAAKDSDSASDQVFGKPKRRSTFGALKSKISRSLSTRLKRPEKRSEKPKGTDSPPAKDSDQATLSTDAVSSIIVDEPGAIEVEPVVTHGHTRTTKITFREVCVAIKESAFVTSDAPLIISLEVHCNPAQQLSMVKIMKEIWGEYLVAERDSEPALLPSPGELKNKILIKVKYSPPEKKPSNEDIQPAAETVEGVKESTESKETKAVPTAQETTSPGEPKGLNETEKPTEIQLTKETKVPEESKGPIETKAPTETEETKITVESKVSEETKEVTVTKETDVSDGPKETKEVTKTKETTLPDGSKEIKETTETKVLNESKEVKEVKETKEAKVAKAPKTIQELSRMGVYTKGVSFKSFTQPEATMTTHIFSLAESTFYMGAYSRNEWAIWEHNKRYMMRTYPSGFRAGSQNLDPSPFWGAGCQIVALNWQKKNSRSMMLNEAMFAGTGGYVLKPPGYHPELEGRSTVKDVITRKLSLTITFLAAQNIPLPLGDTHDRSFRPYVKVAVYSDSSEEIRGGHIQNKELEREDEYKVKTRSYKGCHIDMGNEKVELKDIPGVVDGLTFVRFTIRDDEIGKDDLAAWACVKLDRLGVGYRFIHLFDANDKLSDGAVLVKVEKKLE